jgi:molybdopterin/thiamine biosynthesis adenylyltransferase
MTNAQLGDVLRELSRRGFRPIKNLRGYRSFTGSFDCKDKIVSVEFHIKDWDFIDYPLIKVISGIDRQALTPHINRFGWFCYFQEGSVILDRYAPAISVTQCLTQAQQVLTSILFDKNFRDQSVQDEFLIHWLNGQSTRIDHVLLGNLQADEKFTHYWIISLGTARHVLLSSNVNEVNALSKTLGTDPPKTTTCPCWIFESLKVPTVPDVMPSSIKTVFDWLRVWDRKVYQAIQNVLDTETSYLDFKFASFAIRTPVGCIGFGFEMDILVSLGAKKRPKLYRQYLHGRGGIKGILRLSFNEIGSDFVHSRNLTFADLKGKRIKVIGNGAIGSYLAQALVRLGAGSGNGTLSLIDPDNMKPENLGRHALGYPALFKAKAQVLKEELQRQFPMANIESIVGDVRSEPQLFDCDLVIDATGEESVSEWINAQRLHVSPLTPVLHVWILGNGSAVQTLWCQGRKTACYRCLIKPSTLGHREARFPVLSEIPLRRQIGCTSFSPYSVSAPMGAASLATEILVDWMQLGSPSPMFRTRLSANATARSVKNQNPTRSAGCPACGPINAF